MTEAVNSSSRPKNTSPECVVRLDRIVLGARRALESTEATDKNRAPSVPAIPGFKLFNDFRARPQGRVPTYARVRLLRSLENNSLARIQHERVMPWLRPFRVTLVGDDRQGVTPDEIRRFVTQFSSHRLSLVEIAFDFDPSSGVDEDFVLRHGQFGKSRRRKDRGGRDQVRYGSRASPKLVRCYWKRQLGCYRVELELHSGLLRKYKVRDSGDFTRLPQKLFPAHIAFVRVRWRALDAYLTRRFQSKGKVILEEAQRRAESSLRRATGYLARQGVPNPHRFLQRLSINSEVAAALEQWAKKFEVKIA